MKNLLTVAALALSIAGFTACNDNDDGPGPSPYQTAPIEGNWQGTTTERTTRDGNGNIIGAVKVDPLTYLTFSFSGGSAFSEKYQLDTLINNSGTYSVTGNILKIQTNNWVGLKPDEYVIDSLNAHRLVFHLKTGMPNALGGKTTIKYTAKR